MPVQKTKVHRVNRRRLDKSVPPTATLATATNVIASTKWRMTLNVPFVLNGTPQTFKCSAASGGSATQVATAISVVNPTTLDLTFATGPVSGSAWAIGMNDPAIRTAQGGFVAAANGTF
jgi:hypothetical protein